MAAADSPALGLFSGLSGLAWTWQHLGRLLYGETSAADTADLDEMILEALRAAPWQWEWDLVYGLAGLGIYALDHPERSFAQEAAEHVVDRLAELAIERPQGIAWKTSPEFMTPENAGFSRLPAKKESRVRKRRPSSIALSIGYMPTDALRMAAPPSPTFHRRCSMPVQPGVMAIPVCRPCS